MLLPCLKFFGGSRSFTTVVSKLFFSAPEPFIKENISPLGGHTVFPDTTGGRHPASQPPRLRQRTGQTSPLVHSMTQRGTLLSEASLNAASVHCSTWHIAKQCEVSPGRALSSLPNLTESQLSQWQMEIAPAFQG